jgi:uncharacterized protein (TIGR02996 family)
MSEDGFLRAIHDNPKDDATRLVYADWLDEQGDAVSAAKAEFLRATAELAASTKPKGWKKAKRKRLQELAAGLDTDWLAVVSRLRVENCAGKRAEGEEIRPGPRLIQFEFLCDRRWEELRPTEGRAVRFCDACRHYVHYCDTITEARRHAQDGHCIAVDLGVIRRERDLEPMRMWLGRPSAEDLRKDRELAEPDPVSAERERRKRERRGARDGR